ncbi:GCN5-related N-acetyltransferase 10, chloroplastic-like [Alnus glutinosa]|uniref:GCN5-related N-acetyltransferase 10, chloroplastic-like n=1 Tax=Alnus glutinosa TaxID=3517 RepID=UPI002D780908|nr:GCN5-related N-acetyltransferase 10, chloroplastic-like [Alnus glutinosa]
MPHLLANHHSILLPRTPTTTLREGCRRRMLVDCGGSWRNACQIRGLVVHCSSTTLSSSADQKVGSVGHDHLVNDFGWKVRRLVEKADEMRMVARVQAEAFHVPVALFNDFFFDFFQAEVLSGLAFKLRSSPPNRYACLVAHEATITNISDSQKQIVGVVDVTMLRDKNVLDHLPPQAEEYLYVSGIAVLKAFRRRKIARVLLKACDVLSTMWGFEYLALRAYEDDLGARKLYASAGYQVVSGDPPWLTTWIGRKRRVLMIKRSNLHT